MDRIEKGKDILDLTSLNCYYLFCKQYKHIFHKHIYGNIKLFTADIWKMFQEMFKESEFEIYESRELVIEFV